jgi:alanine racemase
LTAAREFGPVGRLQGGSIIARARLTIDLDAIVANWRALDARSGQEVETGAVLKADAYGLGAARVAPALRDAGVRTFFVALAEEGVALRAALGPGPAILVLSGLMPGDAEAARAHDLVPCLNSIGQATDHARLLPGHPAALQLDSGMNRLGLEPADLDRFDAAALGPVLVMSHLACADEPAHPQNAAQRAAFRALAARFPGVRASLAATGGILLGPDYHFGLTRPGIGLFGGAPFAGARPVVRLALPVIQVREVAPGEAVGYGAAWTAPRPARIATLAAGYADGLLRAIGRGGAQLFAGDRACPIVGRVSMDLITAEVTDLPEVPSHLEILSERQTIDDLAAAAGTIGYEILTSLGGRYERVYNPPAAAPDPA